MDHLAHRVRLRGFSLIESAIVLGIVGLVIGGIWVAAASVIESRRQTRFLEQIPTIILNLQKLYKNMPPNGGTVSEVYYDNNSGTCSAPAQECIGKAGWGGVIPPDMVTAGSDTPVTPWGDSFTAITVMEDLIVFRIPLPTKACASVAPKMASAIKKMLPNIATTDLAVRNDSGEIPVGTADTAATNCFVSVSDGRMPLKIDTPR